MSVFFALKSAVIVAGITATVSNDNIKRKITIKQQKGEIDKHRFLFRFSGMFSFPIVWRWRRLPMLILGDLK